MSVLLSFGIGSNPDNSDKSEITKDWGGQKKTILTNLIRLLEVARAAYCREIFVRILAAARNWRQMIHLASFALANVTRTIISH